MNVKHGMQEKITVLCEIIVQCEHHAVLEHCALCEHSTVQCQHYGISSTTKIKEGNYSTPSVLTAGMYVTEEASL